ncbi:MAG: hypothetical protein L6N96_04650 [Candidatus Methylarchaceae archaeon HK02M2]|nr:hypothetical protein [Candidatus Methylarchaceae archaeon HK02M2]
MVKIRARCPYRNMPNIDKESIPDECGDYHEYETTEENKAYWEGLTLEQQDALMWEAYRMCKDIRVVIEYKRLGRQ